MKPIYLLFALLLAAYLSSAQNWQCMQPGQQVYFTNSAGYLRAMRIDSVRANGTAILFYPYHSPRGRYTGNPAPVLDTNGGSWMGSRIVQQADGTTLFDNIWKDTITIHTQAATGQSWVFYSDTTARYYVATIIREDTLTIEGMSDSVKHLTVKAHIAGQPVPDLINAYTIILSKNHGLLQVFDLVAFPYHAPDVANSGLIIGQGLDYYLDEISRNDPAGIFFKRIALLNPDRSEIYDHQPGDVLQYRDYTGLFAGVFSGTTTDSVASRQLIGNTLQYLIHRREVILTNSNPPYRFLESSSTPAFLPGSQPFIDTMKLPEEWLNQTITYYDRADSSYCATGLRIKQLFSTRLQTGGRVNNFEGTINEHWYKAGIGLVREYRCLDPVSSCFDRKLSYAKKNGVPCGIYDALSIAQPVETNGLEIFPNPAYGLVTLRAEDNSKKRVRIAGMQGNTLLSSAWDSALLQLDISHLPAGIYLLQVISVNGSINRTISIR